MPKKPDAYYRPQTIEEALRLLAQPHTVALAGGTKLLATEEGLADAVVDLQALDLAQVAVNEGALHIGAMTTLTDLTLFLTSEQGQHECTPLLQRASKHAGPNTYRNAATAGGIAASRLPDSELLAALLVLETAVHFAAPEAQPIELAAYLDAANQPAGLISGLQVEWGAGKGSSERVARTPADYPIVSITAWQPLDNAPRLAATGITLRPTRLFAAEAALADGLDERSIEAAAAAARETAVHPGDFRGSAAYRAEMAAVLTRRVLRGLMT